MTTKVLGFFKRDRTLSIALGIFFTGFFLRIYKFYDFVTYLGDQGRDAIVLKRILTLEHFPAIGAPTSVGQVYLGPFYYYFIAPWLWLSNFNPVGPAVGVAFFSSLYVLINYLLIKDLFGRKTALISSALIAFSAVLIELSRFSWNPNLLPLFTLLLVYSTIKAVQTHRKIFYLLAGAFLSLTIQLHYLALFLAMPVAVIFLWDLLENKKEIGLGIKKVLMSFGSFLFFSSPLLVFDLRHDFLNSKNFIKLFQESSPGTSSNKLEGLFQTFFTLNQHVFQTPLEALLLGILLVIFTALFFLQIKTNRKLSYVSLFFLLSLFGLSLYSGPKHPHYYGTVYPLYFILISYLLANLLKTKIFIPIFLLFVAAYVFFNSQSYHYFYDQGSDQITKAQVIARAIKDSVTKEKFVVTALPNQYSDSTYRYFLEVWGKRALEKDSIEPSQELFVICEGECKPIGDPQWDIAFFKPKKVEEKRLILPHITMYRLSN